MPKIQIPLRPVRGRRECQRRLCWNRGEIRKSSQDTRPQGLLLLLQQIASTPESRSLSSALLGTTTTTTASSKPEPRRCFPSFERPTTRAGWWVFSRSGQLPVRSLKIIEFYSFARRARTSAVCQRLDVPHARLHPRHNPPMATRPAHVGLALGPLFPPRIIRLMGNKFPASKDWGAPFILDNGRVCVCGHVL